MKKISPGVVHELPEDLGELLLNSPDVLGKWESLTPLARNEWICWIGDAKKSDTRIRRIYRLSGELLEGKRRPCCPHR